MKSKNMFFLQIKVVLSALYYETINRKNLSFLIISFLMTYIVCFIFSDVIFKNYNTTKTSFFMLSTACIWIGIFNSIQSICSCRNRIKLDYLQGMRISSFIAANVIYQCFISFLQSVIVIVVFIFQIKMNKSGVFTYSWIEYFIQIFLIIFSADMLGLLISSFSKNTVQAMTLMPFVLVVQMIFSNSLFELNSFFDKIALFSISRWGLNGLGSISNMSTINYAPNAIFPEIVFEHSNQSLFLTYLLLFLFSMIYIFISYLKLRRIDKEVLF